MISLVETKVNKDLLASTQDINESLFRSDQQVIILSSNINKLITKRQQRGVLTTAHRD